MLADELMTSHCMIWAINQGGVFPAAGRVQIALVCLYGSKNLKIKSAIVSSLFRGFLAEALFTSRLSIEQNSHEIVLGDEGGSLERYKETSCRNDAVRRMDKQSPNHPPGTEFGFPWRESSRIGFESASTAGSVVRGVEIEIDPVRQQRVLERFFRRWCKTIDAFIRQTGRDLEAVRDLMQDFLHQRLSKKRRSFAGERRKQFRPPPLTEVQDFLKSKWDQRSAKKRDKRSVHLRHALWTNTIDVESLGLQRVVSLASNP